jgi:hypothetical protein
MKSSLHSLISFLPFLLSHFRLPSLSSLLQLPTPELDWILILCSQDHIPARWRLETERTQTIFFALFYNPTTRTTQKTQLLYCWEGVFTAPLHSNRNYSIVACVFIIAGMCLPCSCLTMDVSSDFTIPAFGRHVTVCNDLEKSCRDLICVLSWRLHGGTEENNEKPQDSRYPRRDSNRVPQ